MNRESREHWINEILNEVFLAVIAWEPLRNALIFKGARILNLHLGDNRQSLDIDSNIAPELVASTPDLGAQASFLEEQIPPALRRHFERQNPVKFKLGRVDVVRKPPKGHLRGWNAFLLRIEVQDNSLAGVRGLPMLETMAQFHFHIIPRHGGDVPDPRGGVRWVIPGKAKYW
jgi:hypothetical protein